MRLSARRGVESTDVGVFDDSGRFRALYEGTIDLKEAIAVAAARRDSFFWREVLKKAFGIFNLQFRKSPAAVPVDRAYPVSLFQE